MQASKSVTGTKTGRKSHFSTKFGSINPMFSLPILVDFSLLSSIERFILLVFYQFSIQVHFKINYWYQFWLISFYRFWFFSSDTNVSIMHVCPQILRQLLSRGEVAIFRESPQLIREVHSLPVVAPRPAGSFLPTVLCFLGTGSSS